MDLQNPEWGIAAALDRAPVDLPARRRAGRVVLLWLLCLAPFVTSLNVGAWLVASKTAGEDALGLAAIVATGGAAAGGAAVYFAIAAAKLTAPAGLGMGASSTLLGVGCGAALRAVAETDADMIYIGSALMGAPTIVTGMLIILTTALGLFRRREIILAYTTGASALILVPLLVLLAAADPLMCIATMGATAVSAAGWVWVVVGLQRVFWLANTQPGTDNVLLDTGAACAAVPALVWSMRRRRVVDMAEV